MKLTRTYIALICAVVAVQFCSSCRKYLEVKPVRSLAIPNQLKDLQAILDNETRINQSYLFAGDVASDYYYLNDANYNQLNTFLDAHNIYLWKPDASAEPDWQQYSKIFDVNVVLDEIEEAERGNLTEDDRKRIKGTALFFRGWIFFHIAQTFAPPYDAGAAEQLLGIPLKLTPNIESPTRRATLRQTYQQIIEDLTAAADLLPVSVAIATRPGKAAAYAALSRVYLIMGEYENSLKYADFALEIHNELLDFNDLNPALTKPMAALNLEVLLHTTIHNGGGAFNNTRAKVNPDLYAMYEPGDLRKEIFYKENTDGTHRFVGDYGTSATVPFAGLAVDEIYLTKAECLARLEKAEDALASLNILLEHRWKKDEFEPYTVEDVADVLKLIVEERYKELAFRAGIRWGDLRRLNREPQFAKTLSREIGGMHYTLPPNDPRYTFLIPISVIQHTGIEQNFRN